MKEFWDGFEKQAFAGAAFRLATKVGKSAFKNPLKTLGAGLTAYDVGSSAQKGQQLANASKSMAKFEAGTTF